MSFIVNQLKRFGLIPSEELEVPSGKTKQAKAEYFGLHPSATIESLEILYPMPMSIALETFHDENFPVVQSKTRQYCSLKDYEFKDSQNIQLIFRKEDPLTRGKYWFRVFILPDASKETIEKVAKHNLSTSCQDISLQDFGASAKSFGYECTLKLTPS